MAVGTGVILRMSSFLAYFRHQLHFVRKESPPFGLARDRPCPAWGHGTLSRSLSWYPGPNERVREMNEWVKRSEPSADAPYCSVLQYTFSRTTIPYCTAVQCTIVQRREVDNYKTVSRIIFFRTFPKLAVPRGNMTRDHVPSNLMLPSHSPVAGEVEVSTHTPSSRNLWQSFYHTLPVVHAISVSSVWTNGMRPRSISVRYAEHIR